MPRTRKKTKAAPPAPKAKAKAPVAQTERRVVKRRGRRRGLLTGLGAHEHERDILDQYLHEVSKTPLLTQKEEIALARKVRTGDQEAMQELVKRNLRFVISVAKKYQNRGLPLTALNTGDVRLDAPLDHDGDRSLIERFIAEDLPDTEDQAMDRFLSDEIEQALNTLQRRDAKVLRLYFGLDGGREHTLEEIGGMLGVTRERVRQLRDRALKRLRDGDVGKALASFAA